MTQRFLSEHLGRGKRHTARMGKTAERACLPKSCLFRSLGHTDFRALIMNPIGDAEYELGYLHLQFRREFGIETQFRNDQHILVL